MIDPFAERLTIALENIPPTEPEPFNIFSVLHKPWKELMHSGFISFLMDPRGNHGLGTTPLEAFLKLLKEKHNNLATTLDPNTCSLYVEYQIDEKRRLDILARDTNGNCLIIENKVYASDQPNQLKDYLSWAKNQCSDPTILYLTLDEDDASDISAGPEGSETRKAVINIGYGTIITPWLRTLVTCTATQPYLRESLLQYIDTIENLTGQGGKMDKRLMEVLKSSAGLSRLPALEETILQLKSETHRAFWADLEYAFGEENLWKNPDIRKPVLLSSCQYWNGDPKADFPAFIRGARGSRFFGLMYDIGVEEADCDIRFFIEVEWKIYAGFAVFSKNDFCGERMRDNLDEKYPKATAIAQNNANFKEASDSWIGWRYLEANRTTQLADSEISVQGDGSLDMRNFNSGQVLAMADPKMRKGLIDGIAKRLQKDVALFLIEAKRQGIMKE